MSRRLLTSLAVVVLLGACAPRVSVTRYRTLPAVQPTSVAVFTERTPDRKFDELGLIEVTGAQAHSYSKLIATAREEAAKLGADAMIVSRRPIKGASALALGGPLPGAAVEETETPRLWVVAITWRR